MAERDRPPVVLEGHLSIEAALEANVRAVREVIATNPGDRRLRRLRALARQRAVPIRAADEAEVVSLAGGRSHGGVIALAGPRRYLQLDALLASGGHAPLLVMLDGIEDPFNFGGAIRALHAAGVDGLVVRERSWETAAGTVARASAGASELIPTATVAGAAEAAETARSAGLQVVVATMASDGRRLWETDLVRPTLLLVGGERRGVTRSFGGGGEVRVSIPYGRSAAAPLTAATAAAILAFEALRQRTLSGR